MYAVTIRERKIAEKNGIKFQTVDSRLRAGWDREKALTHPTLQQTSYRSLARSNDIPVKTYENRVYLYGWEKDEAATIPVDKRFRRKELKT